MRSLVLITILTLTLSINNHAGEIRDEPPSDGCTGMASSYNIEVKINSSNPLPSNLGVALNGRVIEVDECTQEDWFSNSINFSEDRTHATIYLTWGYTPIGFEVYFPEGSEEPATNAIDLIFYSRENCTDPRQEFQQISDNNAITWEPIYANGERCGVTSYKGEAQVEL